MVSMSVSLAPGLMLDFEAVEEDEEGLDCGFEGSVVAELEENGLRRLSHELAPAAVSVSVMPSTASVGSS